MAVLLKDLEELRALGQTYELDPAKKYLILIPTIQSAAAIDGLNRMFMEMKLQVAMVVGMDEEKWKIFEMEHQA